LDSSLCRSRPDVTPDAALTLALARLITAYTSGGVIDAAWETDAAINAVPPLTHSGAYTSVGT